MPIYEYQCKKCHEVCEAFQKYSDPPLRKCPHCGGRVDKLMSMNAFHLKGSGWYTTDYAGKNASTRKGEGASDSGDAGSDAKPKAEKAEKKDKKKESAAD